MRWALLVKSPYLTKSLDGCTTTENFQISEKMIKILLKLKI